MTSSSWRCILAACLLLGTGAARAQPIDPALAKSWAFMQSQMPDVPYDVLKSACAEGTLSLYHGTWTEAEVARVQHFRERFPCISVKRLEMVTASLRDRFMAEFHANRPTADIIQDTEQGALDDEAKAGVLMNYTISNDADYPDAMKRKGFWYPLRMGLIGIAWNTTLVSDDEAKLLTDWKGLLNPAFKNRIGLVDANAINILPFFAFYRMFGEDYLKQLGTQAPRIYPSANPAAAALASGDISVLFNASETGLVPLWLSGAPIRWSLPEPGIGPVTGQAISKLAPHPNAAKLYQEYAFSTEGYGVWQKLGGAPARIGFKDGRKVAAESWYHYPAHFLDYDTKDASDSNDRILGLFRKWVGAAH